MAARYDLTRFREAQASGVYERALAEIRTGRKKSHWMWFVFPQIHGLGFSATRQYYALESADEARAYLADNILGPRLCEICQVLLELPGSNPHAIFGSPDDLKLFSSMTLFDYVAPNDIFTKVLAKYYGDKRDARTLAICQAAAGA